MSSQLGTQYQAGGTFTITLASLASSTTAGRQGTAVDFTNAAATGIGPTDVLILLKFKSGTGTTANGEIQVFVAGSIDGGTLYTGGATGSDAAYTLNGNEVPLGVMTANADSTQWYGGPWSVKAAMGAVPAKLTIIVQNISGATADTTAGNFSAQYQAQNLISS